MITSDNELRHRFIAAMEEVVEPAPWLEAKVVDAIGREARAPRRRPVTPLVRNLRFAAAVAALLIAAIGLSALLFSARMHGYNPVPAHTPHPGTSASPAYSFTPSPAVRLAKWPAGGPVPASLAGCWQSTKYANNPFYTLCMGGYTFDFGQGAAEGNVVVTGSEIDFISDTCTPDGSYGYDRYHFSIASGVLTLIKFPSPPPPSGQTGTAGAWGNCGWRIAGTYAQIST
jgi:hypothetical protein